MPQRGAFTPRLIVITLHAKVVIVEFNIFLRHLTNRAFACKKTTKLKANVACTCVITILRKIAVHILANAQSSNLMSLFCFKFFPRSTFRQASTTCFRCVVLWRECYQKTLCNFAHQANANAWWIFFVARAFLPCNHTPCTIC